MNKPKIRSFTPEEMYKLQAKIFKEFYKEFGEKAIPVIVRICQEMGKVEGKNLKTKHHLPRMDLKEAAIYLGKWFRNEMGEAIEVDVRSPEEIHWKVTQCAPGFELGDREVCLAVMKGDEDMINTLCDGKAKLTVRKAIAFGDDLCDIVLTPCTKMQQKESL